MDSPGQGANGTPTTATTFENSVLNIIVTILGATFIGELINDVLEGMFSQDRIEIPVNLTRGCFGRCHLQQIAEQEESHSSIGDTEQLSKWSKSPIMLEPLQQPAMTRYPRCPLLTKFTVERSAS